jgi:hypothetical protein
MNHPYLDFGFIRILGQYQISYEFFFWLLVQGTGKDLVNNRRERSTSMGTCSSHLVASTNDMVIAPFGVSIFYVM